MNFKEGDDQKNAAERSIQRGREGEGGGELLEDLPFLREQKKNGGGGGKKGKRIEKKSSAEEKN